MSLADQEVECAEINFLCVHKDLRAKRLAPILIKEITRRVNLENIWQAVYTAGAQIPTPITGATYWHRSLDVAKLLECKFTSKPANTSKGRFIAQNRLPEEDVMPDMRPMTEADIPEVTRLLTEYLSNRKIHINFNQEEVQHFFMPQNNVIYTYVCGQEGGTLTDLFSFYCLPSQILGGKRQQVDPLLKGTEHDPSLAAQNSEKDILWVAYSYYNVSTTDRLELGMQQMLINAHREGFHVFNALDVMENSNFLENLKFGEGDGQLYYYLYNWRMKDIVPADLGIVLV